MSESSGGGFALGWLYQPEFPADWTERPLIDLASWINGRAFKTREFSASGLPVIKIAEIKGGIQPQTKFTNEDIDEKYLVDEGTLLFSWSGQPETSIGAYVWDGPRGWLNQHVFRVVPADGIDRRFLRYLLDYLSPNLVGIAKNKQTTGLGHVTRKDLQQIEVGVPSPDIQARIGSAIGVVDERITDNLRIMDLCHELAVATVGTLSQSCSLGDLVEPHKRSVKPEAMSGEEVHLYSIPAFDDGMQPEIVPPADIKSNKLAVDQKSVLISRLNPKFERCWLVHPAEGLESYCSSEYLPVRPSSDAANLAAIWAVTSSSGFWELMRELVTGTSGSHQRVRWEDVLRVEVPDVRLLSRTNAERLQAVADLYVSRRTELLSLGRTRATLVEGLFRGELTLSGVAA